MAIGLAAGTLGGTFGVGGGVIIVPGLVLWIGLDQHRASATSVTAIVAVALSAVIQFAVDGEVVWSAVGWILVGALSGAFVAARFIERIPAVWLARAFFALVVIAAARMWLS
jgi:uncharacterized membrane protein YfcA